MLIKIRQIKIELEKDSQEYLKKKIAENLKIKPNQILKINICKKSLDARKEQIYFIYEVNIETSKDIILNSKIRKNVEEVQKEIYEFKIEGKKIMIHRPIIIGSGPAGLFCAYELAKHGYKPIIYERGEKMEERINSVEHFWKTGILKENSNVQFGEGGAGTFSDGKLNTLVKEKHHRSKHILETFVKHGAPEEILYLNKPHIGTDLLKNIIPNMREQIIKWGGEFHFNTCVTDIDIQSKNIKAIELNNKEWIDCEIVVFAIGHSARDTFELLYQKGMNMEGKPFAIGVRIEHPQKLINNVQYHENQSKILPSASYKLTYTSSNKRGVYSFCMCPGGYVVNASSEQKMLAINGMSNYKRDSKNANSAIVVTIKQEDFGYNPLDGVNFQRELEKKLMSLEKERFLHNFIKTSKKIKKVKILNQ